MVAVSPSWFQRNPKKTLTVITLTLLLGLDALASALLLRTDYHWFRRPHYYYHHGWSPNIEATTIWGETKYPVRSNSLGLADRYVRAVPPQAPGTRVLFVGDSFTEGVGVTYDESFVGIVDGALDARGADVLNAGVSSYSPKLYYLKTKFLIEGGLVFDQLFVFIDISDAVDELAYEGFEGYQSDYLKRIGLSFRKWAYAHSYSYRSASDLLFQRMAERHHRRVTDDHWGRPFRRDELEEDLEALRNNPFLTDRWDVSWTVDDDAFEGWAKWGLALAASNMTKLLDLCRSRGIQMTIGVYPWPDQIRRGDLDNRQVRFWKEFAAENDVAFIDLFPAFMAASPQPEVVCRRYYIDEDVHWNAAGHQLVAATILSSAPLSGAAAEAKGMGDHSAGS
jgi:hypothetical protein